MAWIPFCYVRVDFWDSAVVYGVGILHNHWKIAISRGLGTFLCTCLHSNIFKVRLHAMSYVYITENIFVHGFCSFLFRRKWPSESK